jgi:hypothetical protein
MANVISEPALPNQAAFETQIHSQRSPLPVSDIALSAKAEAEASPYDAMLWIKYGRALRRQSMHREAIDAYSLGAVYSPFYALLYRHRGHAYINICRYAEAASDFELSLRLDPSDIDVWYHLGLSYFLMTDYNRAEKIYKTCYHMSTDSMDVVSCSDWLWITLQRLGKKDEAEKLLDRIQPDMEVGVCASYLKRLLMYKGVIKPEELIPPDIKEDSIDLITMGFGLANYYYVLGDDTKGDEMIRRTLSAGENGNSWSAFGYQAASVEKKRRNL